MISPESSLSPFTLADFEDLEVLDFLATGSLAGASAGLFPRETASLFVGETGFLFFGGGEGAVTDSGFGGGRHEGHVLPFWLQRHTPPSWP